MRRRKFVHQLGKIASLSIVAPSFLSKSLANNLASGNVLIIGAGAAGLYAAKVLKEAGVNVTILEASSIHGGRIKPILDFSTIPIEMGAEEVHGKGNTSGDAPSFLWSSIDAYNSDLLVEYGALDLKEIFALDESYVVYPPYWDADLNQVEIFYENLYAYTGDDVIMNTYLEDTFGVVEGDRTWHLFEAWIGAEYGSSVKDYGMKSMAISENLWLTGGKNFALDTSYLQLLDTLWFNSVLENITYNKEVVAIEYTDTFVSVSCSDASIFTADKIICTVPLSILKLGSINFIPPLPSINQNAIDTLKMGNGMKIALKFSEKFWGDEVYDITFKSYPTIAWSPGLIRTGGEDRVLLCFCMGERADYLSSIGEDAIGIILTELDLLFDGAATETFLDAKIQDWIKEPFIQGSYSYPAPETYISEIDSRRIDLGTPVDCKIFFAGEATNNNHPSTVHGALETGARAAAEVLECLSVSIQENSNHSVDSVNMFVSNDQAIFQIELKQISRVRMYLQSMDGKLLQLFYFDAMPTGKNIYKFQVNKISFGNYLLCCAYNSNLITQQVII